MNSKKFKAVLVTAMVISLLGAAPLTASALSVKVKGFYEDTGIGLLCGNPKICKITPGKAVDGFVLEPEKLKNLGVEREVKKGASVELIYQGGNFWTIKFSPDEEGLKVRIQ